MLSRSSGSVALVIMFDNPSFSTCVNQSSLVFYVIMSSVKYQNMIFLKQCLSFAKKCTRFFLAINIGQTNEPRKISSEYMKVRQTMVDNPQIVHPGGSV